MNEHCPQCRLPEPANWCWEHSICCPLSKPISNDATNLLPALRTVIWLLAEREQRTNDIHGGGRFIEG